MKRNNSISLGLATAFVLGLSVASPALAQDCDGGHQGHFGRGMMPGGPEGRMPGGPEGRGGMMRKMMRMLGAGMGAPDGMMGGDPRGRMDFMKDMDADGDGRTTPEELRAGLAEKLKTYDADGDGSLSIAEFETLHSAAIRERMVDRFQRLDSDGDGKVTEAEMMAPADRMEKMMKHRKAEGHGRGMNKDHGRCKGDGNGAMMENQEN